MDPSRPPLTALPSAMSPRVEATRVLAVGTTLALIALCLVWELWLARTGSGTLALKALPLALPLPGLWRMRLYTYRWLSLFIWLYVTEGLVRATSDRGVSTALAAAEVVLAVAVFAACGAHVRARLRDGAALTAA